MSPLGRFSRANLRRAPEFKALADVPHNLKAHRLVAAARVMAKAARKHTRVFDAAQFPANIVQELEAAADSLEKALDARTAATLRRVVATAGVQEQIAFGREAVALLDPVVVKRLAGRLNLLAGWRSATRVTSARRRKRAVTGD
jgi:DNA-directed RNA polymerase specialized sigma54-like protein